ncbi:hypothetical protein CYMTET_55238 [Cymbomonas tetramitiformis]|uniref:Uncharacterized protein n=1 Tax=Cymbomonas tetramitiformis TaxID=36881 RepID=A0AAE0BDP3_9CHLO|nr:hypothetical protein CYMTET_55238 [Cymbomonas tetramitiformis]
MQTSLNWKVTVREDFCYVFELDDNGEVGFEIELDYLTSSIVANLDALFCNPETPGHMIIAFIRIMTAGFAHYMLGKPAYSLDETVGTSISIKFQLEDDATFRQNIYLKGCNQRVWNILADKPTYYERQRFVYNDNRDLVHDIVRIRETRVWDYIEAHIMTVPSTLVGGYMRDLGIAVRKSSHDNLQIEEDMKRELMPFLFMPLKKFAVYGQQEVSVDENNRLAKHIRNIATLIQTLQGPLNSNTETNDIEQNNFMTWAHEYTQPVPEFNAFRIEKFIVKERL